MSALEIKVKISNEEKRLTRDFLIYDETLMLSKDDPELKKCVDQTVEDFKGDQIDRVTLTIKMEW